MTETSLPARIEGRYLLEERIARGGSADVWRAHDEELDRRVAVKLLHSHLVPDELARLRLAAEGRLVASLDHPSIVKVYDVLAEGDNPALVMELIEGESLNLRLARDGAIPARAAAAIGAEVAEALAEAHRHGIVHRDLKPSNILLDTDGHAHLADFGIAHSLEPDAERLTQTGMVVGTPAYIAPEQLAGTEVGPRTDIFGLGSVLFEMLAGVPPFAAMAPLPLAQAHSAGPPAMPGIDPELVALTRACLAESPSQRPGDAALIAATLRSYAAMDPAERDAETRVIPIIASAAVAEAAAPPSLTLEEHLAAWWRLGMPFAAGAAALFVAVLLAAALLGPGSPAAGAPEQPSATPTPEWATQLMSAYADACDATLDPAQIDGLSQPEAEAQVSSLIDACDTAASPSGGGGGGGSGSGKGSGKDKGNRKP
jgi:eukaryotic-like serine/threonine-protein kinase